ncbi:MAG: SusC/RagA family TonB-linked outer membrane protein [Bacteroidales bacterium]|jgi:TonB-linked SusC/RagA family outer membrane protein|nr:SusC/RagA family TonB-linked outer membrane protein [Bacteroidales bacterium]
MNTLKNIICSLLMLFCLYAAVFPASGQKKTTEKIAVSIEIVDETGNPVGFAQITSAGNRHTYTASENGTAQLLLPSTDVVKIIAPGYATAVLPADQLTADGKVTLSKEVAFSGEEHKLYTLFGETTERRSVGAYSKVNGSDLEANPTMHFMNALGGRLGGLYTMDNTLVPGFTTSSSHIRTPQGDMLILIDGVERSLDYLEPETVESVQILKDASLKSLYGGVQTNGILMIKTRRGKEFENGARINVQTGIQKPTRLPKYLNAYDYAVKYNEAAVANGMDPYFNPDGYLGGDPMLYPDVDYYDMFLNDNMTITRANMQYSGGNKNTRFFTHLGYQTNGGLESFTEYPNRDRVFTLRGNVDNRLLDFITFSAGFNTAWQMKSWSNISTQDFFNMLSDNRPNEFPILIPGENVGNSEKEFVLGGTAANRNNPYGALCYGGNAEREYSYIQTDFALDFDLNKWVPGLSVKPVFTFDVYNYFTSTQGATYVVFEPRTTGDPDNPVAYTSWGTETRATSMTRSGAIINRNYAFNLTATYNRAFGKHDFNALLVYYQQTKEYNSLNNALKRLNFGGLLNYMYDNRYMAEVSLNRVGVSSFAPEKRFGTFPTFGAGWIISEEDFMKNTSWIDYLKIRASYGILGSTTYTAEGLFSDYLYRDVWEPNGTYAVSGFNNIARETQTGNPDVGFQKNYDLNAGVDVQLLNRSLYISAGFFRNVLKGALANLGDITAGVSGKNAALMMHNYKDFKTEGVEAEAMYEKRVSDWKFTVGANMTWGFTKITKEANPPYPDSFAGLMKITRVGDVKGQQVIGTFENQTDIDASPRQDFGAVRPGDLKYADPNGDNVVDSRDQTIIANTTPALQYGITLKIEYKGFNLDLLGYGLGDFDRMLDSKYYQIYGARKYSNVLIDGLPNGNPHPALSPEYRNNNFIASDYWVVNGSYFKLRNAELGYTLPYAITSKIGMTKVKVYLRGFNLFTISKIKDLDPESLDAGVGNFPLCTTLTGGLSISF